MPGAHGRKIDDVFLARKDPGPPGRPETLRPRASRTQLRRVPPGTEAAGLWRPTRCKGEPALTRRQASEGRSGGPAIRHQNC